VKADEEIALKSAEPGGWMDQTTSAQHKGHEEAVHAYDITRPRAGAVDSQYDVTACTNNNFGLKKCGLRIKLPTPCIAGYEHAHFGEKRDVAGSQEVELGVNALQRDIHGGCIRVGTTNGDTKVTAFMRSPMKGPNDGCTWGRDTFNKNVLGITLAEVDKLSRIQHLVVVCFDVTDHFVYIRSLCDYGEVIRIGK
jgi:hypothetical protein